METSGNYLLLPSAEQLAVVKLLMIVVFLIHLPYICMMIGGSLLSVIFNFGHRQRHNPLLARFSRDIIDTIAYNKSVAVIFGLIPLLVIVIGYGHILYHANAFSSGFLVVSALLALIGIGLIYIYKHTFHRQDHLPLFFGMAGHGVLILAYFLLWGAISHFSDPEKWAFIRNPLHLILSWKVIWKFLHFSTLAMAVTGAGLVFFILYWRRIGQADSDYQTFVKKFGIGLALVFTLAQPIFMVLDLINTVDLALSMAVFFGFIILLILLLIISYVLLNMIRYPERKTGTVVFLLYLIFFLVMVINEGMTRENAIAVHTRGLLAKAQEVKDEIHARREAAGSMQVVADVNEGEKVFDSRCTACHRFDIRLVGPPLNTVVPNYLDNLAELKAYLASPAKKNPDYPAMPNLGLSPSDIESVTAYLVSKMKSQ